MGTLAQGVLPQVPQFQLVQKNEPAFLLYFPVVSAVVMCSSDNFANGKDSYGLQVEKFSEKIKEMASSSGWTSDPDMNQLNGAMDAFLRFKSSSTTAADKS